MRSFIIVILCFLVSCFFLGCKDNTIQIKRESKVSEMMKNVGSGKPQVKSSSGVMIYKDTSKPSASSTQNNYDSSNDLNFDLKLRF